MPKPTEQLCANCGNNVKANAKFCPACGTKIETLELVDEEVKTQAKKWVGIRENLEFLEEFREEHSKKNNRKIDSGELRKWAISKLEKLIELKLGDAETNNKLKERLEKNKKIDYDEVDYLEDCLKGKTQLKIKLCARLTLCMYSVHQTCCSQFPIYFWIAIKENRCYDCD